MSSMIREEEQQEAETASAPSTTRIAAIPTLPTITTNNTTSMSVLERTVATSLLANLSLQESTPADSRQSTSARPTGASPSRSSSRPSSRLSRSHTVTAGAASKPTTAVAGSNLGSQYQLSSSLGARAVGSSSRRIRGVSMSSSTAASAAPTSRRNATGSNLDETAITEEALDESAEERWSSSNFYVGPSALREMVTRHRRISYLGDRLVTGILATGNVVRPGGGLKSIAVSLLENKKREMAITQAQEHCKELERERELLSAQKEASKQDLNMQISRALEQTNRLDRDLIAQTRRNAKMRQQMQEEWHGLRNRFQQEMQDLDLIYQMQTESLKKAEEDVVYYRNTSEEELQASLQRWRQLRAEHQHKLDAKPTVQSVWQDRKTGYDQKMYLQMLAIVNGSKAAHVTERQRYAQELFDKNKTIQVEVHQHERENHTLQRQNDLLRAQIRERVSEKRKQVEQRNQFLRKEFTKYEPSVVDSMEDKVEAILEATANTTDDNVSLFTMHQKKQRGPDLLLSLMQ